MKFKVYLDYYWHEELFWNETVVRLFDIARKLEEAEFEVSEIYNKEFNQKMADTYEDGPYIIVEIETLEDFIKFCKTVGHIVDVGYAPVYYNRDEKYSYLTILQ